MKDLGLYTIEEAKKLMNGLSNVFDVVRLSHPENTTVVEIDENDNLIESDYSCYRVWKKCNRCDNCISQKVLKRDERITKYEFVDDDIFFIVASPMRITDKNGQVNDLSLELVCKVTNELMVDVIGINKITERLEVISQKAYKDSLTKAFGRRYFDEGLYLYGDLDKVVDNISFIVMDVADFKTINDKYGHQRGDEILIALAEALEKNIRKDDSLIRMGGDEFVIVMRGCPRNILEDRVAQAKAEVGKIAVDPEGKIFLHVDFGHEHRENTMLNMDLIGEMISEADKKMYKAKREHKSLQKK